VRRGKGDPSLAYNWANAALSTPSHREEESLEQATPAPDKSLFSWIERHRPVITLGLLLGALLSYIPFAWQQVTLRGLFEYVGIDFRLFYASGQIWRDHGVAAIYDPAIQAAHQKPLYETFSRYVEGLSLPFWPLCLCIYVLPFVGVSLLPSVTAFVVWDVINGIGVLGYLFLWTKRLKLPPAEAFPLGAILFLSAANFTNLLFGQVNVFLLVAVGEAVFHLMRGRAFQAGLWLALGWVKPQMILLIVLVLVLKRNRGFAFGFLSGSILVGLLSFFLGGIEGFEGVLNTLLHWPGVLRTSGITWISLVDNLRMKGLASVLAWLIGLWIALTALWAWYQTTPSSRLPETLPLFFLSTLAAEAILMPHGNTYMALALGIPWLVFIAQFAHRSQYWWVLILWSLVPGLLFITTTQAISVGRAHDVLGLFMLLAHLLTLLTVRTRQAEINLHPTAP